MPLLLPEERIGTTIAEKYEIDGILGRGGMGVVFAAHHQWTQRPVAVKLLNPEIAAHADAAQRFLQEARAAARLKTQHVVDVLDMGRAPDGAVYMVMERLEGEPLSARLERLGRLTPHDTLSILSPIMEALVEAHAAGITHRDLKPDNVFLSRGAKGTVLPKLLDFGIAKVTEATRTGGTKTGTAIGTPHYMSPEQVRGDSDVGPSSDIWSMGVLLYECLSGALPYPGDTATGILTSILINTPQPLAQANPDLDPRLVEVVLGTLRPTPAERPPSMEALLGQLRAVVDPSAFGHTLFESPEGEPEGAARSPTPRPASGSEAAGGLASGSQDSGVVPTTPAIRRLTLALVALVVVLLAVGGGWLARGAGGEPSAAVPTVTASAPPTGPSTPSAPEPAPDERPPSALQQAVAPVPSVAAPVAAVPAPVLDEASAEHPRSHGRGERPPTRIETSPASTLPVAPSSPRAPTAEARPTTIVPAPAPEPAAPERAAPEQPPVPERPARGTNDAPILEL